MTIDLQVAGATTEQIEKYKEIFSLLIQKGALDGIRGGNVQIHFDPQGVFQSIELHYAPWRRKKIDKQY